MSFEDLPDDWTSRPLTEPRLVSDVLDLVVTEADRRAGALALLICDAEGRLVQPVVIEDPDPFTTEDERIKTIDVFVAAMGGYGTLLAALARRDGLSIREDDLVWGRAVRRACEDRVGLLGMHLITLDGSRELPAA